MSNPVIVQGVAVADDGKYQPISHYNNTNDNDTMNYNSTNNAGYYATPSSYAAVQPSNYHAEQLRNAAPQSKQFQDVIWAVLFVAHVCVVAVAILYGIGSSSSTFALSASTTGSIVFVTSVTGLVALGASTAALSFMMQHAEVLVRCALIFSVATSLAMGLLGLLTGNWLLGGMGMLGFLIGICYAKIVWPRIPFAATNLNTALTAVRANMGLLLASFGFTMIAFAWTLAWFLGLSGALASSNGLIVFLLFLSYYWTHQVLQNTMHVATAGVVGTWWWVPSEANSFWSTALSDSLIRATTYSFGSVCFGSLLVALVQALRALEYHSRGNDDLQFLSCIIQCILSCIEGIIESLNRWAYVYVGLYGFSYLEAGRNVIQLFESKGWTALVADDLADNVLFMMSVAIGLVSGLVGLAIGALDSGMFVELGIENAALPGFGIGFLAGFLFASIIMSVVGSGVNTVIVCFAEDPAAFEANYPQLSAEMRAAWTQAWPGLFN